VWGSIFMWHPEKKVLGIQVMGKRQIIEQFQHVGVPVPLPHNLYLIALRGGRFESGFDTPSIVRASERMARKGGATHGHLEGSPASPANAPPVGAHCAHRCRHRRCCWKPDLLGDPFIASGVASRSRRCSGRAPSARPDDRQMRTGIQRSRKGFGCCNEADLSQGTWIQNQGRPGPLPSPYIDEHLA
jgi:hypothetical protein